MNVSTGKNLRFWSKTEWNGTKKCGPHIKTKKIKENDCKTKSFKEKWSKEKIHE